MTPEERRAHWAAFAAATIAGLASSKLPMSSPEVAERAARVADMMLVELEHRMGTEVETAATWGGGRPLLRFA